jgi:hypothetical protein
MRHVRRYEDVIGLALAGLAGLLVLLYVRRTSPHDEDPAVRALERELDVLSGEYAAVDEELGPDAGSVRGGRPGLRPPDGEKEPERRGRRRA